METFEFSKSLMSALFWISVFANLLMGIALVFTFRWNRANARSADNRRHHQQEEIERRDQWLARLQSDSCALAESVAISLEAIRLDIDRNYHHTHDGHVLDIIADRLRRSIDGRSNNIDHVCLNDWESERVVSAGGQVDKGMMNLGQMLAFAWHLHSAARERSGQLLEVVRQPCGNPNHAAWWSKTLAIYELMCGQDRTAAIKRMLAVADAWKHEPGFIAARYAEDIR